MKNKIKIILTGIGILMIFILVSGCLYNQKTEIHEAVTAKEIIYSDNKLMLKPVAENAFTTDTEIIYACANVTSTPFEGGLYIKWYNDYGDRGSAGYPEIVECGIQGCWYCINISKPKDGWKIGKYNMDFYLDTNDAVLSTEFKIVEEKSKETHVIKINTSSSAIFFPVQSDPHPESMMAALLMGELELVNGCLRVGDDLVVWPHGFSVNTKDGVINIIDDTGKPIAHVGDKIRFGGGGGEMPDEHIAKYSTQLPSDDCPGPYWIAGGDVEVRGYKLLNPNCVSDDDCVKVQKGCCPCSGGGELVCMSKGEANKHWEGLDKGCEVSCAAWYRCSEFENLKCKCLDGKCESFEENPENQTQITKEQAIATTDATGEVQEFLKLSQDMNSKTINPSFEGDINFKISSDKNSSHLHLFSISTEEECGCIGCIFEHDVIIEDNSVKVILGNVTEPDTCYTMTAPAKFSTELDLKEGKYLLEFHSKQLIDKYNVDVSGKYIMVEKIKSNFTKIYGAPENENLTLVKCIRDGSECEYSCSGGSCFKPLCNSTDSADCITLKINVPGHTLSGLNQPGIYTGNTTQNHNDSHTVKIEK